MRPTAILAPLCLLASVSSAWQPLEVVRRELAQLLPRQDATSKSSFNLSFSSQQGNTATTESSTDASTTGSDSGSSGTQTGSSKSGATATGTQTGSGKQSGSATATSGGSGKSTKASVTGFDPRLPPGGVQMVTPAPISTTYYRINDQVTFAWNYTSLSVTPSAVDILATCTLNNAMYTIAMNQSITNATQVLTWDTGNFQQTAATTLLTGSYTLIIHDAAKEVTATAPAGYLAPYSQFVFGMYTSQPSVAWSEYVCTTCNSANSVMERQTMGFMLGMVVLTVLSFSWFAGVAGII
ncbi:hypothetical protein LTR78_007134 [Recurvomyces mirabilis]|uniref:DUF7137 domain-containing protein n=1 Tax=Recurvomyces mirabilis TaxID=574656 RepID=A0AAE1BYX5_9PEZI|nr:hypothetical protein LTR78_007134 [Recurvomyces mirabilis]KAK5150894.1 hypothetical protein LTS14_009697 [Recurvomyces mirabilis]